MRVTRRRYLAAAAVTALSGCVGGRATGRGAADGTAGGGTTGVDSAGGEPTARTAAGDEVRVETVATGLEVPWAGAWREGDLYLTERPGRVVRVPDAAGATDANVETVVSSLPDISTRSEDGLLGLLFHPEEPFAFTYGTYDDGDGGSENRLVRHDLREEWAGETLLSGVPGARIHDGGRLATDGDALYVTTGDANESSNAQDPDSLAGKVLRVTFAGDPHPDNPSGTEVFTMGHRNPQGLAFRDGKLFSTEHGPATDDEVNVLRAGENYGWPDVKGRGDDPAYVDPVVSYTPTIAPCGATFYDGPVEAWRGEFFFATLKASHLRRLRIDVDAETVTEEERLFEGEFGRLRAAFTGPEGHLYVTTSNRDGRGRPREGDDRVLRVVPA